MRNAARKWLVSAALLGFCLGLLGLTGCASAPYQAAPGQYNYNNTTGYPAVGLRPWLL